MSTSSSNKSSMRRHGNVRGLTYVPRSSTASSRFGRMFRWLPGETYDKAALAKLAFSMIQGDAAIATLAPPPPPPTSEGPFATFRTDEATLDTAFREAEPGDENPNIPAGYTYFGQFIDHDLTFDPNSSLEKLDDPDATENFRTPQLDLDSVYGRGPDDQPYLYDDGAEAIKFILAPSRPGELQRNVNGRAIIGDPRNDENQIISQLESLFLNFHNKVIEQLGVDRHDLDDSPHKKFLLAQRIVRWHYQYLVINDYLPKVVGTKTWMEILGSQPGTDPTPDLKVYLPKGGQAYIPVEFSVAAFRFGHSMVRPSYALNAQVGGAQSTAKFSKNRFNRVPIFDGSTDAGASLDGFQPLPANWEIDWSLFFSPDGTMPLTIFKKADDTDNNKWQVDYANHKDFMTQPGYRIDTTLVDPLAMLPTNVAKSGDQPDHIPSLAYRNLLRGSQFQLPSGQNVARALGIKPLTDDEIWITGTDPKDLAAREELKSAFAFSAPLWYYILKESELTTGPIGGNHPNVPDHAGGHFLGPVGGHIVAEVLVGVLWSDHTSYLYQEKQWTPASEKAKSGFNPGSDLTTLYAVIKWVTGGKMKF
jgi:Animal haem peroxidase